MAKFYAKMHNPDWNTANELVKERKWDEALKAFDRAFTALSEHPDLIHDRAVCLFQVGRKNEALSELNRAVELQPDYSYRYASRAYIRNAMKDIMGAIDDYKKAIELDPEDAISLNNLGMLEEQLGYRKEADERYRAADELSRILKERGIDISKANDEREEPAVTAEVPNHQPNPTSTEGEKTPENNEANGSIGDEIKKVFTQRSAFKEFVDFIRNGLKL